MDTTKTITHLGLCAGYGGIELGLKRVLPTMRTIALCEIEAFAIANLVAKMETGLMDPAPIWTDLKTFPWEEFRNKVDVLSGGYPCQPFSAAGKRLGTHDPRHLWPYIASGIRLLRPKLCFFENVEGHITLGLREVVGELEEFGYQTAWGIFSAAECGAPHQRKRVFILAHRNDQRLEGYWRHVAEHDSQGRQGADGYAWPSRPGQQQYAWEPPRVVGNARGNGWRQDQQRRETEERVAADGASESMGNASGQGLERQWNNPASEHRGDAGIQFGSTDGHNSNTGEIEQSLGRNFNESSSGLDYAELSISCDNRTDELRLLGNGVVPATAELAFRTLFNELHKDRSITNAQVHLGG